MSLPNVFLRVINHLQLQTSSALPYADTYLLLAMLSDYEAANSSADVLANDVDEVLRRLSAYSNTRGFQNLHRQLAPLRERLARRGS